MAHQIRTIKYGLLFLLNLFHPDLTSQDIYNVQSGDSTLTPEFVAALCEAARNPGEDITGQPSTLESLIIRAAGTTYQAKDQPEKSFRWHHRFGAQCYCSATEDFPRGDILRQIVHSNFRSFANIIGPENRLSLDLSLKDPYDGLTIYEYINKLLRTIEESYNNKRFEFQQDEDWRNIMFFFFLFSEYSIK